MEGGGGESNQETLLNQNGRGGGDTMAPSSAYSRRKQTIAALCATIGCLLNGCVIGYTGPAIPSLLLNTTSLTGHNIPLHLQEASWVASILSMGCFLGCILAGPVMERLGRKKTLLWVSSTNYAVGFLLISLAHIPVTLYIGRFLNGMGLGFVLAVVSVYIVEIATVDMRGFLGCFLQFQGSAGVLLTFCLGAVLNWWQLSLAHLVLCIPYVIALSYIPESPRWLIMKGQEWQGEVALKWLRGRDPQVLDREIEQIKREIAIRKRERVSINLLLEPAVIKPFLVALMMMFFLQLSGFNVMVLYTVTIFQIAGSSINPHLAAIIVGVVLLLSCFLALAVVFYLGRKVILVVSILGMSISHLTLGSYYYVYVENVTLANSTDAMLEAMEDVTQVSTNPMGWLPLLAIIGFLVMGNIGYGTLIWVVTAELLPPKVRSIANSIIICFAFVIGFFVAKTFVDLTENIGYSGTFWLYGSICGLGAVCTAIFVPETRDKTFVQIQEHFSGGARKSKHTDPDLGHPLETVS